MTVQMTTNTEKPCPHCAAPASETANGKTVSNRELRDYDFMWGDGKIYCKKCGGFVRIYDRG